MVEPAEGTLVEEPTTTTPPENWYPEEHKDLVEQQGWKQSGDVIRDYGELQKSASGKIKIPTPESSDEEKNAFYSKTGRPDTPEGYEFKKPENLPEGMKYDEEFAKQMSIVAHKRGASKELMQELFNAYNEYQTNDYNAVLKDLNDERETNDNTLKAEWKNDYEPNSEIAKRAYKELCDEDFGKLLLEHNLDNHPVIKRNFHRIGLKILSDTLIKGKSVDSSKDDWKPQYPDSPEMYANDTTPEGERSRLWFTQRGHIY